MRKKKKMPVHIKDMKSLSSTIKDELERDSHRVSKTQNKFSAIPFNQAHEQENKIVKGSGGPFQQLDFHSHQFQKRLTVILHDKSSL